MRPSAQPMPMFLVRATETAHGVPFEMSQHQQGIVIQQMGAHGHFREPLATLDGQHGGPLFIQNVHRGEIPAVHGQGLPVFFRGVPGSAVIGIRLHDSGIGQLRFHELLYPGPGNDVGAMGLACVQFDAHFAGHIAGNGLIDFQQAGR